MEKCIVCGNTATSYNPQGLPACKLHTAHELMNMDCPFCKAPLDAMKGKYGTFLNCVRCGNISTYKLKTAGNLFFMKR